MTNSAMRIALDLDDGVHRDPFDRPLIAQAMTEKMTVLTKDENFQHYPIDIIW